MAVCPNEDDTPRSVPIAIVGMGCRWPGGVRDAPGLWTLLASKGSGYQEFGSHPSRFSVDGFYHPDSDRPGTVSTRGGYLLDEDPRLFDPSFFGIQPLEVETMDVAQRKLLEVVYEAFENAGETLETMNGSRTGVFVGYMASDHMVMQNRDPDHTRPYKSTGISPCLASNRISYIFNLTGPSLTLDTACSSSMYALHLACKAITNGDCDSAIVAGANWIADPSTQITLNKLGALSATSACHTFDAAADGYARGEGFAALYLRKAQVAANEGYSIRAIIRGTAINANGRTGGVTHPSKTAQEAVIREAYKNAGNLPLSETAYFDCHGTGTPIGDPIEVSVIGQVFSSSKSPENPLLLGSAKTNLGHAEPVSGIASIMKVVLALEAGIIPPSIGIETLNPDLDFKQAKVRVVTEMTPWPAGQVRRASVSSFGFGGANGHCIIEHVNCFLPGYVKPGIITGLGLTLVNDGHAVNGNGPVSNGSRAIPEHANGQKLARSHVPVTQKAKSAKRADAKTRKLVLLPFSAHNEASLKLNMAALTNALNKHPLADIAYTLGAKRTKFSTRSFRIVDQSDAPHGMTIERGTYSVSNEPARLGFVFTGQGAQWHGMGRELFEYRVFRDAIQYLDYVVSVLRTDTSASCASWTIEDVLAGKCNRDLVNSPEVSQVVCTALQIGIVDLLSSWSIRAMGVVGHSSGEMAAAYAAGYSTAAESIAAAYCRGQAVSRNTRQGAMLAVGLGSDEALRLVEHQGLTGLVKVAAINSPSSVTLSGDVDAVKTLSAHLETEGIFNRMLKTGGNAYHSHHMAAIGGEYQDMLSARLARIRELGLCNSALRYPQIPWFSSVILSSGPKDAFETGPRYWRSNLEEPVRFSDALTSLVVPTDKGRLPVNTLIEIGPHNALKGPVDQTLKGLSKATTRYTHSLKRDEDGQASLLQLAGVLFGMHHHSLDLAAVNSMDDDELEVGHGLVQGCTVVDLTPYQYSYGPVSYHESRLSKEYRSRSVARHDLLGSKLPGSAKLRPQWRNILRLKDVSWLGDHRWMTEPIFPAAGFIAMAVEASSRVHHELADAAPEVIGFSLRNMSISTALSIPEDDYGIEVLLSMELVKTTVTTRSSPTWASFSISSVVGDAAVWTEHCTGQVKVETSYSAENQIGRIVTKEMDARAVESSPWYTSGRYPVMRYGPPFQVLSGMAADPIKKLATAKLGLKTTTGTMNGGESRYPIHPASIDGVLQLGMIACYGGQIEAAESALMPVHISNLYLRNNSGNNDDDHWGLAIASGELRGLRGAYAQAQLWDQSGQLLLDISPVRYTKHIDESSHVEKRHQRAPFSSPFTRVQWKPDIRTMTARAAKKLFAPPHENSDRLSLLEPLQAIATLIVIDIYEKFARRQDLIATAASDRVEPFLAWVRRRVEQEDTAFMARAKQLSVHERLQWLKKLYTKTEGQIEAKIAKRLHHDMEDILYERRNGLDILMEHGLHGGGLFQSGLLMSSEYAQLFRVLQLLGHANPDQNILEVGAGTGGATRVAMRALSNAGDGDIKQYSGYAFTDISPESLDLARGSMSTFRDMSYSVLDIANDPMDQGYKPVYDTIIASHCLHATHDIRKALRNCHKLLKPGGKLVLVEITQDCISHGLLMGTMLEYWNGLDDGRVDSPFLDQAKWNSALLDAGFSGTELVLEDFPEPHAMATTILSTLVTTEGRNYDQDLVVGCVAEHSNGIAQVVHLLHGASGPPRLLESVSQELRRRQVATVALSLDNAIEELNPGAHIIAFIDGENLLLDIEASRLAIFQHLARSSSSMIWITCCGMAQGKNPDGALVTGLLRTLGTENPAAKFLSIDIDPDNEAPVEEDGDGENKADLVRCVVDKEIMLHGGDDDEIRDREFAWQQGCMWVNRLVPDVKLADKCGLINDMSASRAELLPLGSQGPVCAGFEKPGILTSLYFKPYRELWKPLLPGDMEVKVVAVGLNWKDLAISTGRYDAHNLSHEYSGVVTRLGSAVEGFSVGDHVYGWGRGHFGNYTRVPAKLAQKLGPADDLVEMATMPLVFMTAVYAFQHVTHLNAGDKVLIQSASGGLGLAAIQVAQSKGAEVFATVGTADKARFLTQTTGIPATHIFGSREVAELPRAVAATKGRGFDVILSTSNGDMLYESLKALHPLGRLIDVGRMDVQQAKKIGLELFQRSISFSSFDLAHVIDVDPELGASLIKAVHTSHRAGDIGPVRPFSAYDVSQLDQVLLKFSKGTHVGKLVITFLDPGAMLRIVPPVRAAQFHPQATYIIIGGWGTLGRSIIRWMADRGARNIAVLSRSGSCAAAAQVLTDDLAARGTVVTPLACDVGVRDQVFDAVKELSSKGQIKGVIHAAMAPEDFSFDTLSIEQWHRSLAAKVNGTKNLHDATAALPLDFFVMTTSLVTVIPFATQSAYAAANNFQEAFARYRRNMGLPASAVSFGLVSGLGYLGTSSTTLGTMMRNKVLTLSEHQCLELLEPAFLDESHDVGRGIACDAGKGDLDYYDPLSKAEIHTCLDPALLAAQKREEAKAGTAPGPTPRWYRDARVSMIMRAFDDAYRHASGAENAEAGSQKKGDAFQGGGSSAVARLRDEFNEAIKNGGPEERSSTQALVASAIVTTLADMFNIDAASVSELKSVADYGVDSLISAELRNWFNIAFRTNIPRMDLLDSQMTIKSLAGIVVDKALESQLESRTSS